jgi:hypothetical protein
VMEPQCGQVFMRSAPSIVLLLLFTERRIK